VSDLWPAAGFSEEVWYLQDMFPGICIPWQAARCGEVKLVKPAGTLLASGWASPISVGRAAAEFIDRAGSKHMKNEPNPLKPVIS